MTTATPTTEVVTIASPSAKTVATKTIKPGWRTSEFWVSITLPAVLHVLTWATHVPGPWGIVAGAVGAGLYSLARGQAKRP